MNETDKRPGEGLSPAPEDVGKIRTELYDPAKLEGAGDIPPLYKKIIPAIASAFVPVVGVAHVVLYNFFTVTIYKISDFFETKQRNSWNKKETFLRDKLDISEKNIADLKEIYFFSPLLALPVYLFYLLLSGMAHFSGQVRHIMTRVDYEANEEEPLNLVNPETVITGIIKRYLDAKTGDGILDKLGISLEARTALIAAIKKLPGESVLIENYYRENITAKELMTELSRLGYDTDSQDMISNILDVIPPVQDIIRMAVREAFTPELVQKFGYMDDFPKDFEKEGKKHGYTKDWLMKYWVAHWILPSPQMVFEMLHRGLIDDETVDVYLRAADYPPYWRKAMKGISYQPLTRVDVRRMYRIGTFDNIQGMTADDAVIKAYKDLGYSDYNAKLMLKFTKEYEGDENKKLTEAKITKLYRLQMIDEAKARQLLSKLNYRDEYIDFIIDLVEYEQEDAILDALLNNLHDLYILGRYSKVEVRAELAKEATLPVDTNILFKIWDYEKASIKKLPTRADVIRWVKLGVISVKEGETRLYELGYSDKDAKNYLKEIGAYEPAG